MPDALIKTGIGILGDAPWGTHFCQFYRSKEDLLDILVPYFRAGLEQNEFCMWVTSEPLNEEEAQRAMRAALPDFDRYLEKGQIEFLPHTGWYLKDGEFDSQRALQGWIDKLEQALARGFAGLRLTGNTMWLEKRQWRDFYEYEGEVNRVIGHYRMMAICTYSLECCGASEIVDVAANHQFALIKRDGKWEIIESSERRQAGEAYRTIIHTAMDGFWITDREGRFLEVNDSYCRLIGYSRDELLGMKIEDVEALEAPEKIELHIRKLMEADRERFETRHRCKDGAFIDLEVSAHYSEIQGGRIFVFLRDITARRQAEEALRWSERQLAIRNRIAHIFLTEPDEEMYEKVLQVILGAMGSKQGIFGYLDEKGDLITPSLTREVWEKCQVPGKSTHLPRETWGEALWGRAIREKRSLYSNRPGRVPEGHIPIRRVLVVPIQHQERAIGVFAVANKDEDYDERDRRLLEEIAAYVAPVLQARLQRDIQEEKRRGAEEALRRTLEKLEMRVQERTAELQAYMVKLEQSNRELEDFAFVASHDLQEPLRKIQAFGDRLVAKYGNCLAEEGRDYLGRIQKAGERMQALIQSLLRYSRVAMKTEPFSKIDLNGLVREVVADLEAAIARSGGEVRIGDLPSLEADAHQMRQLFQNLIGNALKFTGAARPLIRIHAQPADRSPGWVRIFVEDNGIGFEEKYLDRIFSPFQRLHGRDKYEGTGMGLAICRRIAERHRGSITARSTAGKGSIFIVSLPLKPGREKAIDE